MKQEPVTKIVIPKGHKVFNGDVPGIATENIPVKFDGNYDTVAGELVIQNHKDLLPLLEHTEEEKDADGNVTKRINVEYNRQGMRIETAVDGDGNSTKTPEDGSKVESNAQEIQPTYPHLAQDAPTETEKIVDGVNRQNGIDVDAIKEEAARRAEENSQNEPMNEQEARERDLELNGDPNVADGKDGLGQDVPVENELVGLTSVDASDTTTKEDTEGGFPDTPGYIAPQTMINPPVSGMIPKDREDFLESHDK